MPTKKSQSRSNEDTVINNLELMSIKALLAYAAHDKNVSECIVRDAFSSRFGIEGVESLPRSAFDDAIRFLVDIQIAMIH